MDDQLYDQILRFYSTTKHKYPQWIYDLPSEKRSNAKSQFRQIARPFQAKEGILYHGEKEVLNKSRLPNILKAFHDNPNFGGHFGRDKTLSKISERYYWKRMKNDVHQYVKACQKCFVIKPKTSKEAPPLINIPVPVKVWSLVGIDMIGPLQETTNGNRYIIAATDHFSKWTEATAVPDKSAKSTAKFLYSVICRLGCMDILISDQGREFVNIVIDNLMKQFQTDHRIASAYHPQTNGQRERDNRTLKETLSKLVNEQGNDWDQFIPGVLLAYHTSVHGSTKCTPFEIMYGRKAKLPTDLRPVEDGTVLPTTYLDNANPDVLNTLTAIQKKLHLTVSTNIHSAQSHQKCNFDRRNTSNQEITDDSIVYIKNHRRIHRMGSKMEPRWIGPYRVVESLNKGRVKLKNIATEKILRNTYHVSNLKVYSNEQGSSPNQGLDDSVKGTVNGSLQQNEQSMSEEANIIAIQSVSKPMQIGAFNPLTISKRKRLCITLGLTFDNVVYYGRTRDLEQPRRTYKTKGDGNCYFRAISYILTGTEDNHILLRDKVVQHMNTGITKQLQDYLNQNVEEYIHISGISRDGVWATDAEILATANLLRLDIVVYTKVGDSMDWLTYPASFDLQSTTEHGLYLQNQNGHFDVVISV